MTCVKRNSGVKMNFNLVLATLLISLCVLIVTCDARRSGSSSKSWFGGSSSKSRPSPSRPSPPRTNPAPRPSITNSHKPSPSVSHNSNVGLSYPRQPTPSVSHNSNVGLSYPRQPTPSVSHNSNVGLSYPRQPTPSNLGHSTLQNTGSSSHNIWNQPSHMTPSQSKNTQFAPPTSHIPSKNYPTQTKNYPTQSVANSGYGQSHATPLNTGNINHNFGGNKPPVTQTHTQSNNHPIKSSNSYNTASSKPNYPTGPHTPSAPPAPSVRYPQVIPSKTSAVSSGAASPTGGNYNGYGHSNNANMGWKPMSALGTGAAAGTGAAVASNKYGQTSSSPYPNANYPRQQYTPMQSHPQQHSSYGTTHTQYHPQASQPQVVNNYFTNNHQTHYVPGVSHSARKLSLLLAHC